VKEGGILLSVHCDSSDWTKKAKERVAIRMWTRAVLTVREPA
jgi:hypothetical protein